MGPPRRDDAQSPEAKIKIRRLPAAFFGNALTTTRSTKKRRSPLKRLNVY